MSLNPCPECAGAVSDKALACPHCGHPVGPPAPPSPSDVLAQARANLQRHNEEVALVTDRWLKDEISKEQCDEETESLLERQERDLEGRSQDYKKAYEQEFKAYAQEVDAQLKEAQESRRRADAQLQAEEAQLAQSRMTTANPTPAPPPDKQVRTQLAVSGVILLVCTGYVLFSLRTSGFFESGPPQAEPSREPTRASLQTADYGALARKACDNGWNAIISRGGIGQFDKAKFDERCVVRVTQAATDCGRTRSSASEVSECVGEAASAVAIRVLEESL